MKFLVYRQEYSYGCMDTAVKGYRVKDKAVSKLMWGHPKKSWIEDLSLRDVTGLFFQVSRYSAGINFGCSKALSILLTNMKS